VTAEDADLIAECLSGRTEAYGELVRRYQDRLFNAVYRFLDSAEDAQDVVQESFLSAYQALDGFEGGSRFFTWLYRIAMNHAIDLKRKRKVILHMDVYRDEALQPPDEKVESNPEEYVAQQEDCRLVRAALKEVSEEHRMVLVLKDLDGLKYEEIAEILGVPIGTIRSRLHRARLELRLILEKKEAGA
jgi:RNA polymerase sigma-70 factor (ECF subfamily)